MRGRNATRRTALRKRDGSPGDRLSRGAIRRLALAASGKVKADIELQPLSSINRVFERLQRGDVASRVVLEFDPA
jgi:hypothetical protein